MTDSKEEKESLEQNAKEIILKYFECNSNVNNSASDVDSLCNLFVNNVKVDYPSFQTKGESENDLNEYKTHVSKTLSTADKISKHRVYPTSDNQFKFNHLSSENETDNAIISIEIPWTYDMEFINCAGCLTTYLFCCIGGKYQTNGINSYRLKYDSQNQLKICYVQTVMSKK